MSDNDPTEKGLGTATPEGPGKRKGGGLLGAVKGAVTGVADAVTGGGQEEGPAMGASGDAMGTGAPPKPPAPAPAAAPATDPHADDFASAPKAPESYTQSQDTPELRQEQARVKEVTDRRAEQAREESDAGAREELEANRDAYARPPGPDQEAPEEPAEGTDAAEGGEDASEDAEAPRSEEEGPQEGEPTDGGQQEQGAEAGPAEEQATAGRRPVQAVSPRARQAAVTALTSVIPGGVEAVGEAISYTDSITQRFLSGDASMGSRAVGGAMDEADRNTAGRVDDAYRAFGVARDADPGIVGGTAKGRLLLSREDAEAAGQASARVGLFRSMDDLGLRDIPIEDMSVEDISRVAEGIGRSVQEDARAIRDGTVTGRERSEAIARLRYNRDMLTRMKGQMDAEKRTASRQAADAIRTTTDLRRVENETRRLNRAQADEAMRAGYTALPEHHRFALDVLGDMGAELDEHGLPRDERLLNRYARRLDSIYLDPRLRDKPPEQREAVARLRERANAKRDELRMLREADRPLSIAAQSRAEQQERYDRAPPEHQAVYDILGKDTELNREGLPMSGRRLNTLISELDGRVMNAATGEERALYQGVLDKTLRYRGAYKEVARIRREQETMDALGVNGQQNTQRKEVNHARQAMVQYYRDSKIPLRKDGAFASVEELLQQGGEPAKRARRMMNDPEYIRLHNRLTRNQNALDLREALRAVRREGGKRGMTNEDITVVSQRLMRAAMDDAAARKGDDRYITADGDFKKLMDRTMMTYSGNTTTALTKIGDMMHDLDDRNVPASDPGYQQLIELRRKLTEGERFSDEERREAEAFWGSIGGNRRRRRRRGSDGEDDDGRFAGAYRILTGEAPPTPPAPSADDEGTAPPSGEDGAEEPPAESKGAMTDNIMSVLFNMSDMFEWDEEQGESFASKLKRDWQQLAQPASGQKGAEDFFSRKIGQMGMIKDVSLDRRREMYAEAMLAMHIIDYKRSIGEWTAPLSDTYERNMERLTEYINNPSGGLNMNGYVIDPLFSDDPYTTDATRTRFEQDRRMGGLGGEFSGREDAGGAELPPGGDAGGEGEGQDDPGDIYTRMVDRYLQHMPDRVEGKGGLNETINRWLADDDKVRQIADENGVSEDLVKKMLDQWKKDRTGYIKGKKKARKVRTDRYDNLNDEALADKAVNARIGTTVTKDELLGFINNGSDDVRTEQQAKAFLKRVGADSTIRNELYRRWSANRKAGKHTLGLDGQEGGADADEDPTPVTFDGFMTDMYGDASLNDIREIVSRNIRADRNGKPMIDKDGKPMVGRRMIGSEIKEYLRKKGLSDDDIGEWASSINEYVNNEIVKAIGRMNGTGEPGSEDTDGGEKEPGEPKKKRKPPIDENTLEKMKGLMDKGLNTNMSADEYRDRLIKMLAPPISKGKESAIGKLVKEYERRRMEKDELAKKMMDFKL